MRRSNHNVGNIRFDHRTKSMVSLLIQKLSTFFACHEFIPFDRPFLHPGIKCLFALEWTPKSKDFVCQFEMIYASKFFVENF